MIDAHCHVADEPSEAFLAPLDWKERGFSAPANAAAVFYGVHPWSAESYDSSMLCRRLEEDPLAGVGEIGLDRLKSREISPRSREVFLSQLEVASAYHRPVVLHGAKCWGEVVKSCKPFAHSIPSFLFHGFSRSGGLVADIKALNGFISIGPALLNDHAVNYRRLACEIPLDMLLVESDRTLENSSSAPKVEEIARLLAALRNIGEEDLMGVLDLNARRFAFGGLSK